MRMTNTLISLRFPKKLLEEIDGIVKEGHYSNRTEFIKSAARQELWKHKKSTVKYEENDDDEKDLMEEPSYSTQRVH